jgi:hypothetical protein
VIRGTLDPLGDSWLENAMNFKRLVRTLAVVLLGCGLSACGSVAPLPTEVEQLQATVRIQTSLIEDLIRALANAQRTAANYHWTRISEIAEYELRSQEGLADDAPLTEHQWGVIREISREKLGRLLGYDDAREEDLLRAARTMAETLSDAGGSPPLALERRGAFASVDEVDELFRAQLKNSTSSLGYAL